jgi:hypothetical protein
MLHKLGRTRDAQRVARSLVKRWPKVAAFRLDAARFALRTDQPTEYLKQARYVVREDFGVGRSPGTMRDLLEILRIGGLRSLYERGLLRTGVPRGPQDVPELSPVLSRLARRPVWEGLLTVLGELDRGPSPYGLPPRGAPGSLAARCLSTALRIVEREPRTGVALLGVRGGVALRAGAMIVSNNWNQIVEDWLPRLSVDASGIEDSGATGAWERLRLANMPPPHTDHVMVGTHDGVVLFGGSTGRGGLRGATWILRGDAWSRHDGSGPRMRMRHAAAYDPVRRRVVLFGGSPSSVVGFMKDTWEFDGRAWHRVATSTHPSPRNDHAMAYDVSLGRVVLFGGRDAQGLRDDLWTFDGRNWREVRVAPRPPRRRDHCLAWDPIDLSLVVFGGFGAKGSLGDTWRFADGRWTQLAQQQSPDAGVAMAFCPRQNRLMRFGGHDGAAGVLSFFLDRHGWRATRERVGTATRSGHAMVHDLVEERVLLFGGWCGKPMADLYEYR